MSKADKDSISQTAPRSGVSRRSFLKGAGAAGLAASQLGLPALEAEQTRPDEPTVSGPDPVAVRFRVNGQPYVARCEPRVTLADALRDHLGLSGTKVICDRGVRRLYGAARQRAGRVVHAAGRCRPGQTHSDR